MPLEGRSKRRGREQTGGRIRKPEQMTDVADEREIVPLPAIAGDVHAPVSYTHLAGVQKVDAYLLDVAPGQVYGVTDDRVAVMGTGNTVYLVTLP